MRSVGRPADPTRAYTMSINTNGKYKYADTQRYKLDSEGNPVLDQRGYKKYVHVHWGTVDDEKRFHPNSLFMDLPDEEKQKFIFPEDWILDF